LDSQEVKLSPNKGLQFFGSEDYDYNYIKDSSATNDDPGAFYSAQSNSMIYTGDVQKVRTVILGGIWDIINGKKLINQLQSIVDATLHLQFSFFLHLATATLLYMNRTSNIS
jgi:hypothetical protein